MCLISFAYRIHPEFPLIVAANRDEFLVRRTAPAQYWDDAPGVLAGRDLEAGGTWMGVSTTGRFSALTNYRDPASIIPDAPSRGQLVSGFLSSTVDSGAYLHGLGTEADAYNGFNLLTYDGRTMNYVSNVSDAGPRELKPGLYGVSNHLLDTPWPKVKLAKSGLQRVIRSDRPDVGEMLAFMHDTGIAPDHQLPETGVSRELERALSAAHIRLPEYGTRCSTVLLCHRDGWLEYTERSFSPDGSESGTRSFRIERPSL